MRMEHGGRVLSAVSPGFNLRRGGDEGKRGKERKQQRGTRVWRLKFSDKV